jgi:plastocyanin
MERRDFLRRTAPFGFVALAGCSGSDSDPTDEPASTATPTASPTATPDAELVIDVGPGGDLVFDPATASVDVGATVAWVWRSSNHSVTVESTPADADWSGTGTELHDTGFVHEHTFDVAGVYDYYCDPHRGAGMEGTVTVGDATPTETETATETPTETETATPTVEADMTVSVGAGGDNRFSPESFTVSTGDTVRWVWDSPGHNVSPESQPEGASWPGRDDSTYDSGTTHTYTFDVAGEYEYHCDPHQGLGMRGSFTVE